MCIEKVALLCVNAINGLVDNGYHKAKPNMLYLRKPKIDPLFFGEKAGLVFLLEN